MPEVEAAVALRDLVGHAEVSARCTSAAPRILARGTEPAAAGMTAFALGQLSSLRVRASQDPLHGRTRPTIGGRPAFSRTDRATVERIHVHEAPGLLVVE